MGKNDDKTEDPTPKRLREARKKGQIAKSQEVGTWGTVLLASFLIPKGLSAANGAVRELFVRMGNAIARPEPAVALDLVAAGGRAVLVGTLPLALAMLGSGMVVNLAQTRGVMATKRLKPDVKRINPFSGFKRLFSAESGWNSVKVLARTFVLAFAAWLPLRGAIARLGSAEQPALRELIASIGADALRMVKLVAVAGLLLGVVDYVVTRRRLTKSMRMTKQEVKDEHRSAEGDPQIKGQIRQRQREMSRNRMLAAVADASVVVVNPTHVAVALRYDPGSGAPRLVAKGKGAIATRIREEAAAHSVPIVRDISLAWALHDTCPLDHPIPADLYAAVAKVLAFVMTVGKQAASMGGVLSLRPS